MSTQSVEFDQADFESGIRTAMTVGLSPVIADRPIFVFAGTTTNVAPADSEQVPFDPAATPVVVQGNRITGVICSYEYVDATGQVVDLGTITPTRLRITMLDAEYQLVRGFDHVLIAGDRYNYRLTQPVVGMVDSAIWIVHCTAEDDS